MVASFSDLSRSLRKCKFPLRLGVVIKTRSFICCLLLNCCLLLIDKLEGVCLFAIGLKKEKTEGKQCHVKTMKRKRSWENS